MNETETFGVVKAVEEAKEKIEKENNPGPKIRLPKKLSLGKDLRQRSQVFLSQIPHDVVKMSDRNYTRKNTGWVRIKTT